MALEIKQNIKLAQQLVITPQLQQAIKLLQLTRMELVDVIQEEMNENPLLEEAETAEEGDSSPYDGEGREEPGQELSKAISPLCENRYLSATSRPPASILSCLAKDARKGGDQALSRSLYIQTF